MRKYICKTGADFLKSDAVVKKREMSRKTDGILWENACYERWVFFMYIRKSFLKGIVLILGIAVLLVLVFFYGFTQTRISGGSYMAAYTFCLVAIWKVEELIERI